MEKDTQPDPLEKMTTHLIACQKLALMGRLSTVIIHEVNNQLTGVSGYAQLLLGQDRAKVIEKELEQINTSAGQCQRLIADLRRVGRFARERELNNINTIIKTSVDFLRHQYTKKSLRIVEDYSTDVPPLEVDTPGLEQAFLNIIHNSLEALGEKGDSLSVTTSMRNGWIVATFEDNGPGFSEDARRNLFAPFCTTKAPPQGLGLGLTVTKMLVEAHGGTIEVDSRSSGGAHVTVSIPSQQESR